MKFTLDQSRDVNVVVAFEPGRLKVRDLTVEGSVIISASQIIADWAASSSDDLSATDLDAALALEPEILLLGTGPRLTFPAPDVHAYVTGRGVGFEVMDTAAACRTYNVLVYEERSVVAALFLS